MKISRKTVRTEAVLYAVGHFLIDFSCALIMLSRESGPWHFIAYNFLAFAVQMPIGLLADLFGRNRWFALIGVLLVLFGFLPTLPWLQTVAAGLGNACYHVGGGRDALLNSKGLTGLGVFVSPGAIGIFLGTAWAGNHTAIWIACILLFLCGILIAAGCSPEKIVLQKGTFRLRSAGLMFLVVILRSFVGMCIATPWKIGIYITLGAVAGAAGKAFGGILADRFGAKLTGVASLLAAAVLFLLPEIGVAGVLAMLLFNMTMPITLGRAAQCCSGYEGFSFGLLTFGLFLGYVPVAFGISISPYLGVGLSVVSAVLLLLDREERHD